MIPKWEAFLERFPDVSTCAAAPLGDVLREWQGLGYPRRARNLHETARRVASDSVAFHATSTDCWLCPVLVNTRPGQ